MLGLPGPLGSLSWPCVRLYAFPLPPLLLVFLRKVKPLCAGVLLEAPGWLQRQWMVESHEMLEGNPWYFKVRRDMLSQVQHMAPRHPEALQASRWLQDFCQINIENHFTCHISLILSFLQHLFVLAQTESTISVYLAAVSTDGLCGSACWTSSSTFTRCYLLNLTSLCCPLIGL